jgi:hypothetical protein
MRQRHTFQRHSETLLPIFTTLLAHKLTKQTILSFQLDLHVVLFA